MKTRYSIMIKGNYRPRKHARRGFTINKTSGRVSAAITPLSVKAAMYCSWMQDKQQINHSKMDFDKETKLAVWQKAQIVSGYAPELWRKDQCGAWIGWNYYGNRSSQYGWEIDHIIPVSKGGTDVLSNLRPLQWENNAARQDDRLCCKITSDGTKNVEK